MTSELIDVLVVGAGLSGISAGYHLQTRCPDRSYLIVESRQALGGTWDLFRYPGVRSDSDMHTLGFAFRPWSAPKAIADGETILNYLQETAREFGIDRKIRYGVRVERADWSTDDAQWSVTLRLQSDGSLSTIRCGFLFVCSGYYDYARGYQPDFPGLARFTGRVVHPQHWPQDLDYAGRRIVVIGSGATAVTLVPALAELAAHVTLLQRSPSWLIAMPSVDAVSGWLRRLLPLRWALWLTRWKNVLLAILFFQLCQRRPQWMRKLLLTGVRRALGPTADIATDFSPRYNPWAQRLCIVPDGDLFRALESGRAAVVTGQIETLTETGVRLQSGASLPADIIVSATGLVLQVGKVALQVDGQSIDPAATVSYKGVMFSGVPNLANTFGYTNASWTLKADLTAEYVCRLLNHLRKTGTRVCLPPAAGPEVTRLPWTDFSSGYFQRAASHLPKQGAQKPWKLNQNYLSDVLALRYGAIDDGTMRFSS